MEIVDRYSATGTPYPHPLTVCGGYCEGMGIYPQHDGITREGDVVPREKPTPEEQAVVARYIDENGEEDDGWYFIPCPKCNRTGRCGRWETLRRIPGWIAKGIRFLWDTRRGGYYGAPHLPLRSRFRIAFL